MSASIPEILFVDMLSAKSSAEPGSYGIKLLCSYLEAAGIRTVITRCLLEKTRDKTHKEYAAELLASAPGIIAFSTFACNYLDALLLASSVKKLSPHTLILMGGPQASATAEETLAAFPFVDVIVKGESDAIVSGLVGRMLKAGVARLEGVPGVVYRSAAGKLIVNPSAERPFPLENLPFIPAEEPAVPETRQLVPMETGRGCRSRCTYCYTCLYWGSGAPRTLPAGEVIKKMRAYLSAAGGENRVRFHFFNDNMTQDKAWFAAFLWEAVKLRADFPRLAWRCSSRPDSISADIASRLAAAGCSSLFIGLESGSPVMRRKIGKYFDSEELVKIIAALEKPGIRLELSFIVGFPDETADELEETLSLALRLRLLGAHTGLHLLAVMPKTKIERSAGLDFLGIYSNFATYDGGRLSLFQADKKELEALIAAHRDIFPFHYSVRNARGAAPVSLRFLEHYGNFSLRRFPAALLLLSRFCRMPLREVVERIRSLAGAESRPAQIKKSPVGFFAVPASRLLEDIDADGGWLSLFAGYEDGLRGNLRRSFMPEILQQCLTPCDLLGFERSLAESIDRGGSGPKGLGLELNIFEFPRKAFLLGLLGGSVLYVKDNGGECLGFYDGVRILTRRFGASRIQRWAKQPPSLWR